MLVKGSFEDFFYILVGLIWVAYSIYKGVQKKKLQNSPNEKVKKKSVLENLMDEFLEKEAPVQPEPIVYEATSEDIEFEEKKDTEVFSYDDIYEESNYNAASDVYRKKPETKTKLKTELKISPKKSKTPRFNLRKAVIYSELLNSRYF
ncbi:MAG: hypothetical protein DRI89_03335 [Bacteroidetes bacterium]|nr:MAG: hypothetical protein DRI89_03335 [Bacteroidota bacterium]